MAGSSGKGGQFTCIQRRDAAGKNTARAFYKQALPTPHGLEAYVMLKLYGFSVSNYYNMVKLALLEKGLPFEEVPFYAGQTA